jgi:hypothetical protein
MFTLSESQKIGLDYINGSDLPTCYFYVADEPRRMGKWGKSWATRD